MSLISNSNRREFLRGAALTGAGLALSNGLLAAKEKTVLVFTKSSGWEHDVVKRIDGKPSIVDDAVTDLGNRHEYKVGVTKDGRIFDSKEFHSYAALVFFTTGDLTTLGTDGKPPMSAKSKQNFHKEDPYLQMLGAEFIVHGSEPRLQDAPLIVNDAKFPGLEHVNSPVSFNEEWYSLKDFVPDLHVILTLDTHAMKGECYQRAPYPVTWARMHGKGRVFYTAMGDRPENWKNEFFLNLLGGGIRWAIGDASAQLDANLKQAAPGYAEIPPPQPAGK